MDSLRKCVCSEFETECDISINSFEFIDDFLLRIIGKETNVGNDPISVFIDRDRSGEIIDKFNELRNSILSSLVEQKNIVFYVH